MPRIWQAAGCRAILLHENFKVLEYVEKSNITPAFRLNIKKFGAGFKLLNLMVYLVAGRQRKYVQIDMSLRRFLYRANVTYIEYS